MIKSLTRKSISFMVWISEQLSQKQRKGDGSTSFVIDLLSISLMSTFFFFFFFVEKIVDVLMITKTSKKKKKKKKKRKKR